MRTLAPWFLLALVACNGDSDSDTNVDPGDIDGSVDGDADAYSSLWGIDGSDPDCEAFEIQDCPDPVEMEGDTRFYVGELVWDGEGNAQGYEAKVVFPNDTWRATTDGVDDCIVVWNLSGSREAASGAFQWQFTLNASLDQSASTCLPAYVNVEEGSFSEEYLMNVNEAGDATVFFPSGTQFATGLATDSAVSFVSGGDCEWLGTGEC